MKIKNSFLFSLLILVLISCKFENEVTVPTVPEWAKEAVWYQIFPERFMNGDPSNDPNVKDVVNIWPYIEPKDWQVSPWTSDWFKRQPWEEDLDYNFYQFQGLRRYGGDLQGVIDKLDYLEELGITAIYFNPIFEAPSHHKYDAKLYHHIDNNFGPDPEKDMEIWSNENPGDPSTWKWSTADKLFLDLLKEAHKRNIKIIIDGVFNHVGTHFWAFKDLVEKQEKSEYKDWFDVISFDDPATEENEFDYHGWIGFKGLPEFKEDSTGLVNPVKDHVFAVVSRWMDPNNDGDPSDGIDGWRLDVAEMVNIKFWKEFRNFVKAINPNAYITGEIWWDDWKVNKMFNAAPWLQGDAFDAVMNYRFTRAVKHLVSDVKDQVNIQGFVDSLANIRRDYNKENLYVLMNLLGSHDTERLSTLIVNPDTWYDHLGHAGSNENLDVRKPNEVERLKQKLMVGIQMTMPGAPMVYSGDEAGMWGGDDPDCRKPMVWPEFEYEDETTHPFNKARPIDQVSFNHDLFKYYKTLITIRKENLELSKGELDFIIINNEENILGYRRTLETRYTFIILNNSNQKKEIEVDPGKFQGKNRLQDLISKQEYLMSGSVIPIPLEPYQIVILK